MHLSKYTSIHCIPHIQKPLEVIEKFRLLKTETRRSKELLSKLYIEIADFVDP